MAVANFCDQNRSNPGERVPFQTHRPVCVVKEYAWFSGALERGDFLLSFSFASAVVLHRQV